MDLPAYAALVVAVLGAIFLGDSEQIVWISDFAVTRVDHVLKDLAKLENTVLFEYVPLESDADLARALAPVTPLPHLALPARRHPFPITAWIAIGSWDDHVFSCSRTKRRMIHSGDRVISGLSPNSRFV